jgi:hypothetical protein
VVARQSTSRIAGDSEYVFRHALVRDGAYAMLTDGDRELAHQVAGSWLARAGEGDPAVLADVFHAVPRRTWRRASSAVRPSSGGAERLGSGFLQVYTRTVCAVLHSYAGDPFAESTMSQVLGGLGGNPRLAFLCHVHCGWLALDRGDVDAAKWRAEAAGQLPLVPELRPAGIALRSSARSKQSASKVNVAISS